MSITNNGAVTNSGTGTTMSATFALAPASGELLTAWCASTQTISASAGWNGIRIVLSGNSSVDAGFFWRIAGASEPTAQTVANSGASSGTWRCQMNRYSASSGWPSTAAALVNIDDNTSLASTLSIATSTLQPSWRVEALIMCGGRGGSGATFTVAAVNGSTTGVNKRTDANAQATWDLMVATTTGTYQGTITASASGTGEFGAIVIFKTSAALSPPSWRTQLGTGF